MVAPRAAVAPLRVRALLTLGPALDGAQLRCPPNAVVHATLADPSHRDAARRLQAIIQRELSEDALMTEIGQLLAGTARGRPVPARRK